MALKSGIFNSVNGDRVYKAEDFAAYFASFIGNGVFPNPSNGFQVVAGAGMSVNLKAGKAWINGYYATNDGDYNLQLDVADGVLNRIDRVVLQLNYLNRTIVPVVKKGVTASSPVAPAIKRDADAYEIALADIRINKGALSITQANITDLRLNTELCGIVHGVVDQVDTTTIFNQYQSWYNQFTGQKAGEFDEWIDQKQSDFETWFSSLREILEGDIATNLANRINEVERRLTSHSNDDTAHGIGDRTQLLTVEKTTLIGAVNELFTSANDGKVMVANAVTAKGVSASPTDTFPTLATKIGRIFTGIDTSDANAVASDLMYSKTAYVQGRKIVGSYFEVRPGDYILARAGNKQIFETSWIKAQEITVFKSGKYRVSFRMGNAYGVLMYGRIYINGVAKGIMRSLNANGSTSFTEDLIVNANDKVQIYAYTTNGGAPLNLSEFSVSIEESIPTATVTLN